MDRLDQIKRHFQESRHFGGMTTDAEKWLIAEVERLREYKRARNDPQRPMSDLQKRFNAIYGHESIPRVDAFDLLVTDVERLRRIEDAALDWHRCRTFGETVMRHCSTVSALKSVINANPRPESGG